MDEIRLKERYKTGDHNKDQNEVREIITYLMEDPRKIPDYIEKLTIKDV